MPMQRSKANNGSMVQRGREIKEEELAEIQETVATFPSLNRYELAKTISEHLGWFAASGGYKTVACVKLLERLEAKGCIKLRAKRASPVRKRPRVSVTPEHENLPRAEVGTSPAGGSGEAESSRSRCIEREASLKERRFDPNSQMNRHSGPPGLLAGGRHAEPEAVTGQNSEI
jgi:hypothetical protein